VPARSRRFPATSASQHMTRRSDMPTGLLAIVEELHAGDLSTGKRPDCQVSRLDRHTAGASNLALARSQHLVSCVYQLLDFRIDRAESGEPLAPTLPHTFVVPYGTGRRPRRCPRRRPRTGSRRHAWRARSKTTSGSISSSRSAASTRPRSRASVPRRRASTFSRDIAYCRSPAASRVPPTSPSAWRAPLKVKWSSTRRRRPCRNQTHW
jgi:hypothetical protein